MLQVKGYPLLEDGLAFLSGYLKDRPDRKVTVFCDDRVTMYAEQCVCDRFGGSFDVTVVPFKRYAHEAGIGLSRQGAVMAVKKIMSDSAGSLRCFSARSAGGRGADAVCEMLQRLAESDVTAGMLSEAADALSQEEGGTGGADGMLPMKLCDLALLMREYERFLDGKGLADGTRLMRRLPAKIRVSADIRGGACVFFGFSALTAQEADCVRAACETAEDVLGLFPAGSAPIYANHAIETFKAVCDEFGGASVLAAEEACVRSRAAETLRKRLYDTSVFSAAYVPEVTRDIETAMCGSEEEELRAACARIREFVRKEDGRYGDVAVLVSSMDSYAPLLKKVLDGEYRIPYFADVKKPLLEHPFARFALSVLRAVSDNFMPESAQLVASSPYFGDDGRFRNYLAKHCNYRRGARKDIKVKTVWQECMRHVSGVDDGKALEAAKTEARGQIDYLKNCKQKMDDAADFFKNRKMKVRGFCEGVRKLRIRFDKEERDKEGTLVRHGVTDGIAKGCEDKALEYFLSVADERLEAVLEETERVLGDMTMDAGEFASVLEEGLDSCQVSLLPMSPDTVRVCDITAERIPAARFVLALGMTDSVPCRSRDSSVLSCSEMDRLPGRKRIDGRADRISARVREGVCMNLCSFTGRLFLSYPGVQDSRESEILRYVRRAFRLDAQGRDAVQFLGNCSETVPAARELCAQRALQGSAPSERARGIAAEREGALLAAMREDGGLEGEISRVLAAGRDSGKTAILQGDQGERLYFSAQGGKVSPTLLETYAECPYKCFAERGLHLKERDETAMRATESGTFVHEVLQKTAELIKDNEISDEESCRRKARECAENLLSDVRYVYLTDTEAGKYTASRLAADTAEIAAGMYAQIANSGFEIRSAEHWIGDSEKLAGKIDRVDSCGSYVRIVDYKTGQYDTSASQYYLGRKLQLELYMASVLEEDEGSIPAGMYYFPASVRYRDAKDSGTLPFRMDGFSNGSEEAVKLSDTDVTSQNPESRYVNASLKSRKDPRSRVMDEGTLRSFIRYSELCAEGLAGELREGFAAPSPNAEAPACKFCPFGGMCASQGEMRVRAKAEKINCKEIAQIVEENDG